MSKVHLEALKISNGVLYGRNETGEDKKGKIELLRVRRVTYEEYELSLILVFSFK